MIVAISHNAKAFDLYFVLNRLVRVKLLHERSENHVFEGGECHVVGQIELSSMPLRKLPEVFGLTA
jgi:hypothetical protein